MILDLNENMSDRLILGSSKLNVWYLKSENEGTNTSQSGLVISILFNSTFDLLITIEEQGLIKT